MENKEKKTSTPKRLIANVPPEIHKKIKLMALRRNMTMTQYVLQAVLWRLGSEK